MSLYSNIMDKINIIKETSGTGTTLQRLKESPPVSGRVAANIEKRHLQNSQVKLTTPSRYAALAGSGLLLGGAGLVSDFWSLLGGTGEQKAETLQSWLPLETVSGATFPEAATEILEEEYGTGNLFVNPISGEVTEVKLPDLSDVGKWLLIAGGAIAGLYLLGKYVGRGKQ
jgi:hypothetical protein